MRILLELRAQAANKAIEQVEALRLRADQTWPDERVERLNMVLSGLRSDDDGWFDAKSAEGALTLVPGYKLELVERLLSGDLDLPTRGALESASSPFPGRSFI